MKKNIYPGKFIAIEGLDGAGKSVQAVAVAGHYNSGCVCRAYATCEPTQFMTGGLVRSRLLHEWSCSPECLQLMFAADRANHLEKEILPLLEKGINVICDRYFLSSIAYGGIDGDMDWLTQVNSKFLVPDLTVYLDVPPAVCVKRILKNGRSVELFEKEEILKKVSQNYSAAIGKMGSAMDIATIDGNRGPEAVTADIIRLVDKNFSIEN